MATWYRTARRATGWAVVLLTFAGCARPGGVAEVAGTVTFAGRPLTSGTVTFVGADGRQAATAIAPDGHYRLTRAPVGPVRIGVVHHPRVPPGMARQPEKPSPVPARYGRPKDSGLRLEVQPGKQTFDIELVPEGKPSP
jgi:hypothetical protein